MKQTEIGLIPDDWKEHTLRDLIDILTDYTANGSFESLARNVRYLEYPSYARLIRLTDIRTNFTNEGVYVSKYSYDFLKKSSLHGGELLLANVGAYAGFSFIYPENLMFRGTLGPNMFLIKFFNQKIDNTFAYYAFSHGAVYNQLISKAASSAQPKLNKEDVRTCYINIPSSIQEQQRIAKALSDVDALISTTEKLIQKKKNIKQGTMQNLLTGKKRLPGFAKSSNYKQTEIGLIPKDWEVKSLGELCSLITKQTGFDYSATIKPSLALEHQKNTLPFIQNKDFEEERINFETDFYIPIAVAKKFPKIYLNEDVLLISISGRIGNVAYFKHTQDAFIGGAVGIAHFYDKDNINYCMRYLLSPNGQMQIFANEKSGAQHNLTIADVRKLSIPMPKDNKELTAIANVLSSMDKEIETLNTKLEKYRNLKTAMMQQLLTGKIRLVK